eukprot:3164769-Pleurochrysis_carterae.AAC.1
MVPILIHSLRPTYACAHDNRAHARPSHREHAQERELVSYIVADSNTDHHAHLQWCPCGWANRLETC